MSNDGFRILFTGYAPVHFLCFRHLYERLIDLPGVEVFVSGGLKTETEAAVVYDTQAMYRPFRLPEHTVLSVLSGRVYATGTSSNNPTFRYRIISTACQY